MTAITFIIPVPPGHFPEQAVNQIFALDYPQHEIEILLVKGLNPSQQRNQAAAIAKGELLYFLDDDSYIDRHALREAPHHFSKEGVAVVGGPALTHDAAGILERCFGEAAASWFGTGPARARSRIMGTAREVRGEELICCNLLVRKDVFLASGGFNVALFPNEENELLKRLRKRGCRIFYEPTLIIRRPRRKVVSDFLCQMWSYGRGRAHHLFKGFGPRDTIFLVPSLFVLYLIALAFLRLPFAHVPLILYTALAVAAALRASLRARTLKLLLPLTLTFPLMHIAYGLGLLNGLLRRKLLPPQHPDQIRIVPVKPLIEAA